MRRRVTVGFLGLAGAGAVALVLVLIQQARANQNLVYSVNNLRELGQFAELHLDRLPARPKPGGPWGDVGTRDKFTPTPLDKLKELGLAPAVPAGTVPNPSLPVEQRLSWVVPLLPTFNQKRQPTAELAARLDRTAAWDADANLAVARVPLGVLRHYSNPVATPAAEPAVTQFVGIGGIRPDAPGGPRTPFAGPFRYDEPTPFGLFTDGLSETALFGDVSTNLGPWLRGGPATVRTLATGPGTPPVIGPGGQFGGNYPGGGLFGFADHSVRVLSGRTDPAVLASLFTVAGGGAGDPLPGE